MPAHLELRQRPLFGPQLGPEFVPEPSQEPELGVVMLELLQSWRESARKRQQEPAVPVQLG